MHRTAVAACDFIDDAIDVGNALLEHHDIPILEIDLAGLQLGRIGFVQTGVGRRNGSIRFIAASRKREQNDHKPDMTVVHRYLRDFH